MRTLRLLVRLAAITAATLAFFLAWLVGAPAALVLGGLPRWRARVQQVWSGVMCRILRVRVDRQGAPPREACLLVANHLSYLDIVVLGSLFPCAFVAKSEIAGWPVLGFLARSFGTLFVERDRKRTLAALNARLRARLERGETLVLFPEGTSTAGESVLAFRSALLEPAAMLELPVRHAALRYATPPGERPAPEVVCWWGDMPFLPHLVQLLKLPTITSTVVFGDEPIVARDRKSLAARLHRAVAESFEPLMTHA